MNTTIGGVLRSEVDRLLEDQRLYYNYILRIVLDEVERLSQIVDIRYKYGINLLKNLNGSIKECETVISYRNLMEVNFNQKENKLSEDINKYKVILLKIQSSLKDETDLIAENFSDLVGILERALNKNVPSKSTDEPFENTINLDEIKSDILFDQVSEESNQRSMEIDSLNKFKTNLNQKLSKMDFCDKENIRSFLSELTNSLVSLQQTDNKHCTHLLNYMTDSIHDKLIVHNNNSTPFFEAIERKINEKENPIITEENELLNQEMDEERQILTNKIKVESIEKDNLNEIRSLKEKIRNIEENGNYASKFSHLFDDPFQIKTMQRGIICLRKTMSQMTEECNEVDESTKLPEEYKSNTEISVKEHSLKCKEKPEDKQKKIDELMNQIAVITESFNDSQVEIEKLKEELKLSEEVTENLENIVNEYENNLEVLKGEYEIKLNDLTDKKVQRKDLIVQLNNEELENNEKYSNHKVELEIARKHFESYKEKWDENQMKFNEEQIVLLELNTELENHVQELNHELEMSQIEKSDLITHLQTVNEEFTKNYNLLSAMNHRITCKDSEIEELNEHLKVLFSENNELKEECAVLMENSNEMKLIVREKAMKTEKIADLDEEIRLMNEQVMLYESEVAGLKVDNEKLVASNMELNEEISEFEGIKEKFDELEGIKEKFDELEGKYQEMNEKEHLLRKNLDEYQKKEIEWRKTSKNIEEHNVQLKEKKREMEIVVCESQEKLKFAENEKKLLSNELQTKIGEIEGLKKRYVKLDQEYQLMKESEKENEVKITNLDRDVTRLQREVDAMIIDIKQKDKSLEMQSQDLQNAHDNLAEILKENQTIRMENKEKSREIFRLNQEIKKLECVELRVHETQEIIANERGRNERLTQKLTQKSAEIVKIKDKVAQLSEEIMQVRVDKTKLVVLNERLQAELNQMSLRDFSVDQQKSNRIDYLESKVKAIELEKDELNRELRLQFNALETEKRKSDSAPDNGCEDSVPVTTDDSRMISLVEMRREIDALHLAKREKLSRDLLKIRSDNDILNHALQEMSVKLASNDRLVQEYDNLRKRYMHQREVTQHKQSIYDKMVCFCRNNNYDPETDEAGTSGGIRSSYPDY